MKLITVKNSFMKYEIKIEIKIHLINYLIILELLEQFI